MKYSKESHIQIMRIRKFCEDIFLRFTFIFATSEEEHLIPVMLDVLHFMFCLLNKMRVMTNDSERILIYITRYTNLLKFHGHPITFILMSIV